MSSSHFLIRISKSLDSVWAILINLFTFEVMYGPIPDKTTKRPSNLIKGTFIWVQVSVGMEYQVILGINRKGSGKTRGCYF